MHCETSNNSSSWYARDQGKVMISWIHLVMKLILLWNDPITYWHVQLYKIWGYEILIMKYPQIISPPKISKEHCPHTVGECIRWDCTILGPKVPNNLSRLRVRYWTKMVDTLGQACVLFNILWRFVRVQEEFFPSQCIKPSAENNFVKHWSSHSQHCSSVRSLMQLQLV